jgi:capsular polysaccharide biosynthesis protein
VGGDAPRRRRRAGRRETERGDDLARFTPAASAAALAALVQVGRAAMSLDGLAGAGRELRAWWGATLELGEGGADLLVHPDVVAVARRTAEFDVSRAWLDEARPLFDRPETRRAALSALIDLSEDSPGPDLLPIAQDLHAADPGEPAAALLLARRLESAGARPAQLEPVLSGLRAADGGYDAAIAWLAHCYENYGQGEASLRWLDRHDLRAPPCARAIEIEARVSATLRRRAMPADGGALDEVLAAPPPPLDAALGALRRIVNGDLTHVGGPSPASLRRRLGASLRRLEDHRSTVESLPIATVYDAVASLADVAMNHFVEMGGYHLSAPIAPGPQYGALDPARHEWVRKSLHAHAAWLAERGLHAILRGAPTPGLQLPCRLAQRFVECALELDQPARCEPLLADLASRGVSPRLIDRLLELCALQRGDTEAARLLLGPAAGAGADLHPMMTWPAWRAHEGLTSRLLHFDPEIEARFDYVDRAGRAHAVSHRVPASRIEIATAAGLRLRDTELVIGQRGALLKPRPWHLRDAYGYPDPSPILLSRAARAARLARPSAFTAIAEPVVVLENMDAMVYRNYYHWMLLILSRIGLALDRNLLADRRLLLPANLSPWMEESLQLIGLPADRVVRYQADDALDVADALVISSVEYPGRSLLAALRGRLRAGALVAARRGPGRRTLWLSRRRQSRRALTNEEAIEAIARDLGFEIIEPETMNVADQVRMMAETRAVAGAVGANLTNLAFASPGAHVLGFNGEEEAYPTFVDLCAVTGLGQRWLFGRVDPRSAWWRPDQKPFEISLDVANKELARLARASARANARGG